jgi:uncharacterized cupin superfamily protein
MEIVVEHNLSPAQLETLGVFDWPVWEKEVSRFDWTYDAEESCYIIAGRVTVTPTGGAPVEITAGDYVIFPAGMSCVWDISEPISKHYKFG